MKSPDRLSSVVFIALAASICLGSLTLKAGSFEAPGPRIFPLLLGLGLLASSIALLLTSRRSTAAAAHVRFAKDEYRGVIAVVGIFFLCTLIFEAAGAAASIFLLILLLMTIVARRSVAQALVYSALITAATYLLFVVLLGVRLPKGVAGF